MSNRLTEALGRSAAGFTEIRLERRRRDIVVLRNRDQDLVTTAVEARVTVRCLNRGYGWGVATGVGEESLSAAVARAHEASLAGPVRHPVLLAPVPARHQEFPCAGGRDPRTISLPTKRRLAGAAAETLLGHDRRVAAVRVRYLDELRETWLVTSEGHSLYEERPEITLAASVVAEEDGTPERAAESVASAGAWSEVEGWSEGLSALAERAVARLRTAPCKAQRCPVVLDPRLAAVWIHRALGHRCLADAGPDVAARLAVGTRIGPDLLTVGDDGTALGLRGTLAFDAEGAAPQNTTLVRHGVVVGHLHTRATAAAAGTAPTGNARAAGPGPPAARPTNTYLANGHGSLEQLLRGISTGVYLADPRSATLGAAGLAVEAGEARMIRGGELAEPVKGVGLFGDPLSLFGLVDAVAGDFRWDVAASACEGPGRARVPVSMGAPHVRLVEAALGVAR